MATDVTMQEDSGLASAASAVPRISPDAIHDGVDVDTNVNTNANANVDANANANGTTITATPVDNQIRSSNSMDNDSSNSNMASPSPAPTEDSRTASQEHTTTGIPSRPLVHRIRSLDPSSSLAFADAQPRTHEYSRRHSHGHEFDHDATHQQVRLSPSNINRVAATTTRPSDDATMARMSDDPDHVEQSLPTATVASTNASGATHTPAQATTNQPEMEAGSDAYTNNNDQQQQQQQQQQQNATRSPPTGQPQHPQLDESESILLPHQRPNHRGASISGSQVYCIISGLLALVAILMAPIQVETLNATARTNIFHHKSSLFSFSMEINSPKTVEHKLLPQLIAQSAWLGAQKEHKAATDNNKNKPEQSIPQVQEPTDSNSGRSNHFVVRALEDVYTFAFGLPGHGNLEQKPSPIDDTKRKQQQQSTTGEQQPRWPNGIKRFFASLQAKPATMIPPSDVDDAVIFDIQPKPARMQNDDEPKIKTRTASFFSMPSSDGSHIILFQQSSWIDPCIADWVQSKLGRASSNASRSQHTFATMLLMLAHKVIGNALRLGCVLHCMFAWTYVAHIAIASRFLSSTTTVNVTTAARERIGGYILFKLFLTSRILIPGAVAATKSIWTEGQQDMLNWLCILAWYTCIACFRSWNILSAAATTRMQHSDSQSIQQQRLVVSRRGTANDEHDDASSENPIPWLRSTNPASNGILGLLACILICNAVAAATCIAVVVPTRGWNMAIWLCGECLLLAAEVIQQALQHVRTVWDLQQSQQITALEEQQLKQQQQQRDVELDQRLEMLEVAHARRLQWLETMLFGCQLIGHCITFMHFLHIWSIRGVQWTLTDGLLAIHIHSAITGALQQISQWQHVRAMASAIQRLFPTATSSDLDGDVCCICLGSMVVQGRTIKVLPRCGHLVHATCLRQVVERAPSLEHARCPLCRTNLHQTKTKEMTVVQPPPAAAIAAQAINLERAGVVPSQAATPATNDRSLTPGANINAVDDNTAANNLAAAAPPVAGDQALFRLSTEGILPSWIPIPSFSFEVIRRSPQAAAPPEPAEPVQQQPSILRRLLFLHSMTPEQEALAMENLVDMFPQHNRDDLLQALRRRGSAEAVVESIFLGRLPAGNS